MHRIEQVIDELKAIYTSSKRTYHNIDHIQNMLDGLKESRHLVQHYLRTELAIWFHDAVYDGQASDNEIKSAELWMRKMPPFLEEDDLEWGNRAILSTIDHLSNNDPDIQLLLDLDLAPLGIPYEDFKKGTDAVRQEYSHVSDEDFQQGRKKFFVNLLERPRLYGTDFWYDRLEKQTQDNLRRVIDA